MADDWSSEEFWRLNANVEYMAKILADFIRNCMRASVANDPGPAAFRANQEFAMLLKLIDLSEGIYKFQILDMALAQLRANADDIGTAHSDSRYYERTIMSAAEAGTQLFVESSCVDNAARGRVSQRKSAFLQAIRDIEEARRK